MKFIKFGIVGTVSFVIDFGITYILKEKVQINKYIANGLGFFISAIANFFLNKFWTFNNFSQDIYHQFVVFIVIATFGLVINTGIVYLLNDKLNQNFYISKVLAVFVVMFYNFSMNLFFTFANSTV